MTLYSGSVLPHICIKMSFFILKQSCPVQIKICTYRIYIFMFDDVQLQSKNSKATNIKTFRDSHKTCFFLSLLIFYQKIVMISANRVNIIN
jgi:hypothetical protein